MHSLQGLHLPTLVGSMMHTEHCFDTPSSKAPCWYYYNSTTSAVLASTIIAQPLPACCWQNIKQHNWNFEAEYLSPSLQMTHIPLVTFFADQKICRTPKCKSRSNENRIMLQRNTLITHTHTQSFIPRRARSPCKKCRRNLHMDTAFYITL